MTSNAWYKLRFSIIILIFLYVLFSFTCKGYCFCFGFHPPELSSELEPEIHRLQQECSGGYYYDRVGEEMAKRLEEERRQEVEKRKEEQYEVSQHYWGWSGTFSM